jgi:hypothetical protein
VVGGKLPAEKRAYLSKSVAELEKIASANLGDEKIIESIKHELVFRTTAKARRLLDALNSGGPIELMPESESRITVAVPEQVFNDCETLLASYEMLRSTFTERGEVLSRWGMTDSMPIDLLEKIGSMWLEKLATGYGDAIRTYEQLEKDFKQLEVVLPDPKRN